MLIVNERITIPSNELQFSFARSPGPGGQHVNKVNTKAILKWQVTESSSLPEDVKRRFLDQYRTRIAKDGTLVVQSHRFSQRRRNIGDCLDKVRRMIENVATPPTTRKPTKISFAAKRRRLDSKKRRSEKKRGRRPPNRDD